MGIARLQYYLCIANVNVDMITSQLSHDVTLVLAYVLTGPSLVS